MLSKEVKVFLDSNIRTIEDLEVLFLLRSDPKHGWDAGQVSREIGTDLHLAADHLTWLYSNGLLRKNPNQECSSPYSYRVPPHDEENLVAELASVLLRSRGEVMQYVGQNQIRAVWEKAVTDSDTEKKSH